MEYFLHSIWNFISNTNSFIFIYTHMYIFIFIHFIFYCKTALYSHEIDLNKKYMLKEQTSGLILIHTIINTIFHITDKFFLNGKIELFYIIIIILLSVP